MKKLLRIQKIALLILILLIMGGEVKGQNPCDSSIVISASSACNPTNFTSNGEYWFSFTAHTDTNKICIVRTNNNQNEFDLFLYSGNCNNLIKKDSLIDNQTDSINIIVVLSKDSIYLIRFVGLGSFKICLLEEDHSLHLLAFDENGQQIQDCENDFNNQYVTCPFNIRLCVNDSIAVRLEFNGLGIYRSDSVVFNMPGNIYGSHYVYIPPTFGFTTPNVPVGYAFPNAPGNPYFICATAYYSPGLNPGTFIYYTICFSIYVDSVPTFVATMIPDTVCPACDGEPDNMACVHLTSTSIDWNDPSLNMTINWGNDPNDYSVLSDSCAIFINTGHYPIIVTLTNNCGTFIDTAWLEVTLKPKIYCPDTICILNNIVHFYGTSLCNDATIINYAWEFGDGQSVSGSNYGSVDHTYTQLGNDTIRLIITDFCGNQDTITKIITVIPPPNKPQIIGNHNNCDLNTNYFIANPQSNCQYIWLIGNSVYSSSFPQSGYSINVTWNSLTTTGAAEHTNIIVHAVDTITECYSIDSIKIWKCCVRQGYPVVNDTIITTSAFFNISTPINGTLTIAANINVNSGVNIVMGPEAKIIVSPPYTFTVNTRTIKSQCLYMWDGVYVSDSNAKVVIQNTSVVQDALNGIVSEKGGKFELKNSSFLNNYTSVTIRDYFKATIPALPSHKGKIYGCNFLKDNNMLAPFLNGKPRHGVYLSNVYKFTIGDSAQLSNVFDNVFCGIASYNSLVFAYKNDFKNIKIPTICSGVFGDYINLYCETAIHSVATSSDYDHYNSSLLVSGAGPNSKNTFDNTSTAIYTYSTLTKVNNNKVKNTSTGVYCREASTGSYVINSTFKTNTLNAIKFINILPVLSKITIRSDSILDPTNGIYFSNISSHATNTNYKCKVYNNYITLNKTSGIMYGMRLENSDYVEAYCNTIKRTTLPTTANRLNVRGIQVEQCLNALIRDNTTEKLGLGVKGAGSLLGTQFKCNTSNGNYNGFYFDASYNSVQTALSNQGIATLPNDNKWQNIPVGYNKIGGIYSNPAIIWYYRNSIPTLYMPTLDAGIINITITSAGNPAQSSCITCGSMFMSGLSSPSLGSFGTINENEIAGIINEDNFYNELDASFKYFEKQYAYHLLKVNTSSLNSLTGQYYYDLLAGNIAKFDKVYNLSQIRRIDSAMLINYAINPINQIEINRRWVNDVYLRYIVPQVNLPQNIITDLESLASSSPFVMGDAVYSARAIVNYTETSINPKSLEQNTESNPSNSVRVSVYPNPAYKNINLEIVGLNGEFCKFVLQNYLGINLFEKTFKYKGSSVTIDISNFSNGIYLFEVMNSENIKIGNGRLVINK